MTDRICSDCGKQISKHSKTGRCRACCARITARDPKARALKAARLRRRYQLDPSYRETIRRHLTEVNNRPENIAKKSARAKEIKIWLLGKQAFLKDPDARERQRKSASAAKMAWCPEELRELAKSITRKRVPLAEAKMMIAELHEKQMAEFRRKLEEA